MVVVSTYLLTDIPCLLRRERGHSQISGIGVYKLEDNFYE
jgi:hypothetical protein